MCTRGGAVYGGDFRGRLRHGTDHDSKFS
jgi:hypothetical protein